MNLNKDIKIIEAILFASSEPVLEEDLIEKINEKNKINEYLKTLEEFYSSRGINLSKTGSKWSFKTSPDLTSSGKDG